MPHPEKVNPDLLRLDNRRADRSLIVALLFIVAFFIALYGFHKPWLAALTIPIIMGALMLYRHHAEKAWEQIDAYYGEED